MGWAPVFGKIILFWFAGLGTSSILGGVIMAALWRVSGWEHSKDSLIHAVSS